jgi:hypothetical protein
VLLAFFTYKLAPNQTSGMKTIALETMYHIGLSLSVNINNIKDVTAKTNALNILLNFEILAIIYPAHKAIGIENKKVKISSPFENFPGSPKPKIIIDMKMTPIEKTIEPRDATM